MWPTASKKNLFRQAVHAVRLSMVAALVWGLHTLSARNAPRAAMQSFDLATIQVVLPQAVLVRPFTGDAGLWQVTDNEQKRLALVAAISPQADHVVGYAGPNNVLLFLDDDQHVTRAELLFSSDTAEHVSRVRESETFWQQFSGWRSGGDSPQRIDGVSGATLTSLAIAEAIGVRLSGERQSLRFPNEVTLEEVQPLIPGATAIQADPHRHAFIQVVDQAGRTIGTVVRTGPLVDGVVGYQGPSELLVVLDVHNVITKIRLRGSYDNDQYVRYTRQEASFWSKLVGRSLDELSRIDLEDEGIEGVSGATMTSMAVAETLRQAAQRHLDDQAAPRSGAAASTRLWHWSIGEVSTTVIAFLVVPWSFSRWRGHKRLRLLWQLLCMVAIVIISGNLISLALLAGWTRAGLSFRLAPGLASLFVIALAAPALFGRNVYCDHVCPHGILQQWLAHGLRSQHRARKLATGGSVRLRLPMRSLLSGSAIVIIALAIFWTIAHRGIHISWLEPFEPYAWRVGISVSLIVWVASLVLAVREPMGYCRLACPTGKLLEYVRLKRAGRRVAASDMLLGLLTTGVWVAIYLSHWESTR